MKKFTSKVKTFAIKARNYVKEKAGYVAMCAAVPFNKLILADSTAGADVDGAITSIKALFSDFTVGNLVKIIGAALGIGVILFLFWFAYRFIKRQAVKGLTKGKL